MRLYGRFTMYGEYLMHEDINGLIFKTSLYLDNINTSQTHDSDNSVYKQEKDSTIELLKKFGIKSNRAISGNIPLGYGFAGSTILSCLKMTNRREIIQNKHIIMKVDRHIHGFEPSGLDYEWCLSQRNGFYSKNKGWQNIELTDPSYVLAIFPKEGEKTRSDIFNCINSVKGEIQSLSKFLSAELLRYNTINYDKLENYSSALLKSEIYSTIVNTAINKLLQNGYIAKGIGGLYDKAIVILRKDKINHDKLSILVESLGGSIL